MESYKNNDAGEVNVEKQLREIIERHDSIWMIAMECFELGKRGAER